MHSDNSPADVRFRGSLTRAYGSHKRNGPPTNQVKPLERTMRLDHLQDECTVGKPHWRRVGTPDTNDTERALIPFTTQR